MQKAFRNIVLIFRGRMICERSRCCHTLASVTHRRRSVYRDFPRSLEEGANIMSSALLRFPPTAKSFARYRSAAPPHSQSCPRSGIEKSSAMLGWFLDYPMTNGSYSWF
jgi:hypothetical protein